MDENKTATATPAPQPSPPNPPSAAPDVAKPAAPRLPAATDALVEDWWSDHFPGSAVAQVTAAWNVAFAAKEDLKQRLQKGN